MVVGLNHFFCLVDGDWSNWTEWTSCSQVCNGGEQTRFRECNNPAPLHGGKDCQGHKRESRTCNYFKCPGETIMEMLVEDFVLARLRRNVLTRILAQQKNFCSHSLFCSYSVLMFKHVEN